MTTNETTTTEPTTRQKKLLRARAEKLGWYVFNNVDSLDAPRTMLSESWDTEEFYMDWVDVKDFIRKLENENKN